eukprot:403365215
MEANYLSDEPIHTQSSSKSSLKSQHTQSRDQVNESHPLIPLQMEEVQLEKKGRFQLKGPATKKNSSMDLVNQTPQNQMVNVQFNNSGDVSGMLNQNMNFINQEVYFHSTVIMMTNNAGMSDNQNQQIHSQNSSQSNNQFNLKRSQVLSSEDKNKSQIQSSVIAKSGNISSNNSQSNLKSPNLTDRLQINSADHSEVVKSNKLGLSSSGGGIGIMGGTSNSQIFQNQTIIQIQAQIPGIVNSEGMITIQNDQDVDARARDLINTMVGNMQEAVEVRGRFRVQEKHLNGQQQIGSGTEDLHYSSHDNRQSSSHDLVDLFNQQRMIDQSPLQRKEDSTGSMLPIKRKEQSSRFEITTLNLNGLEKQQLQIEEGKSIMKDSQPLSGNTLTQVIIESPSSIRKLNQKDLFLMNSKSKSQTGYVSSIRNQLAADQEEEFHAENEESVDSKQNQRSKRNKFNLSGYRTNRMGSDASLADREDNYPNIDRRGRNVQNLNKSHDDSKKDHDLDRRSSDDKVNQEDIQQDDLENINGRQLSKRNPSGNVLQESQAPVLNDQDNEADESSAGEEKQDERNRSIVVEKYKYEERLLDGYKYSSELRSDKSQQDVESPNDYSQSINGLKLTVNNQDLEKQANQQLRKERDRIYHKQIITSNEQIGSDLAYHHDQFAGLNNSQHHATQRFDWNVIQNEESFQNVKASSPIKQGIKLNSIHESMDFQSKAQQQRANIFEGSSNSQNKATPFGQNSIYDNATSNLMNNTSNSNMFQKELFNNFARYGGQGMKMRLDSENIEVNQINATLGQSSSNINDQDDLQNSMSHQIQLKRLSNAVDNKQIKTHEKRRIVEEEDEEEKTDNQKSLKKAVQKSKKSSENKVDDLIKQLSKIINKKQKKSKVKIEGEQQRGESQTSFKKMIKSQKCKQEKEDCEQKGRFTIKNSTEDKNNEIKNRRSKAKIQFSNHQQNDNTKMLIGNFNGLQDQISPNRQSIQMMQQMNMLREQSFSQNQYNQMMMNSISSFHPQHQSLMSFNPMYQQNQSPHQNKNQASSHFDFRQSAQNQKYKQKESSTHTSESDELQRKHNDSQFKKPKQSEDKKLEKDLKDKKLAQIEKNFKSQNLEKQRTLTPDQDKGESKKQAQKKQSQDYLQQERQRIPNSQQKPQQQPQFVTPGNFQYSNPNMPPHMYSPYYQQNHHQQTQNYYNPYFDNMTPHNHFNDINSNSLMHQNQYQMHQNPQSQYYALNQSGQNQHFFDQMLRHQQVMFNQMLNCHQNIVSQVINYQHTQSQMMMNNPQHYSMTNASSANVSDDNLEQNYIQRKMQKQQKSHKNSRVNQVSTNQSQVSNNQDSDASDEDSKSDSEQNSEDEMGSIKENEGSSDEEDHELENDFDLNNNQDDLNESQNQGHSFAEQQFKAIQAKTASRRSEKVGREKEIMKKITQLQNMISGQSSQSQPTKTTKKRKETNK